MASGANRHAYDANPPNHNYTLLQAFEWYTPGSGTHWTWLRDNAVRFGKMGITAVWIPPPYKASQQESTGYDTYDLWDMGEFEQKGGKRTKYGTKEELQEAMKVLKENGIVTYIDAVLNHKMGADEKETFKAHPVDENDRTKEGEAHDIDGWTKFTFPGRKGKYSDFTWNFNHFTGVDWDDKGQEKQIFRIEGKGKNWADDVDAEHQNYDYLMGADIDHSHPEVMKDLFNWAGWVIREFPQVAGFRFDAVKHISREAIRQFVAHVREEARAFRKEQGRQPADESMGPVMFSVGEYWQEDVETCLKYLGDFGDEQFSLFDAPLHYNFVEAGNAGSGFDLRKIFDGSIVQARPIDAVTLVSNHDTQPHQALESVVPPNFMPLAYAIILLRVDGMPCVFLGDLDGCHSDSEKNEDGSPKIDIQPMTSLDKFCAARKHFAYGEQKDKFDHPSCVGWARQGDDEHDGCAVVLCVGDDEGKKWLEMGERYKGKTFIDILGWHQEEVALDDNGNAEFKCPAHSCSIWVSKEAPMIKELP